MVVSEKHTMDRKKEIIEKDKKLTRELDDAHGLDAQYRMNIERSLSDAYMRNYGISKSDPRSPLYGKRKSALDDFKELMRARRRRL